MFGALLGKKEQHDEKKELKKEDKEEKKEEKAEEKAIKADVKKEEKAEHQAEKEERKEEKSLLKEEKKALKSDGVVEPKPLDAAAVGKNDPHLSLGPANRSKLLVLWATQSFLSKARVQRLRNPSLLPALL